MTLYAFVIAKNVVQKIRNTISFSVQKTLITKLEECQFTSPWRTGYPFLMENGQMEVTKDKHVHLPELVHSFVRHDLQQIKRSLKTY